MGSRIKWTGWLTDTLINKITQTHTKLRDNLACTPCTVLSNRCVHTLKQACTHTHTHKPEPEPHGLFWEYKSGGRKQAHSFTWLHAIHRHTNSQKVHSGRDPWVCSQTHTHTHTPKHTPEIHTKGILALKQTETHSFG